MPIQISKNQKWECYVVLLFCINNQMVIFLKKQSLRFFFKIEYKIFKIVYSQIKLTDLGIVNIVIMKHYLKFPPIIIFIIGALILTCKKDEMVSRDYPRVTTIEVSDIDSTGALFSGEVFAFGSEEIIDHGFVWGEYSPSFPNTEYVSLGKLSDKKKFSIRVDHALASNKKYIVKAYARTLRFTVYGKEINFVSLGSNAPAIIDFWPDSLRFGEQLYVKGRNLSKLQYGNIVIIENTKTNGLLLNDSIISCVVPSEIDTIQAKIGISVSGNSSYHSKRLRLIAPEIYRVSRNHGLWGDTVTVYGKGFSFSQYNRIRFNNGIIPFLSYNDSVLKIRVPNDVDKVESEVIIGPFNYPKFKFYLDNPEIISLNMDTIKTPTNIICNVKGVKKEYSKIIFNGLPISTPVWLSDNKISIPINEPKNGSYPLQVSVLGQLSNIVRVRITNPQFNYSGTLKVKCNEIIQLNGEGLNDVELVIKKGDVTVQFQILEKSYNYIKLKVPQYIKYGEEVNLQMYSHNKFYQTEVNIKLKDPIITSIYPKILKGYGDTVIIKGENFHPYYKTSMAINDVYGTTLESNETGCKIKIDNIPASDNNAFKLFCGDFSSIIDDNFWGLSLVSPWKVRASIPIENINFSIAKGGFSLNAKGYTLVYYNSLQKSVLFEYNPETNQWINFNSGFSDNCKSYQLFSNNQKGYVIKADYGNGLVLSKQISEFDPAKNIWNKTVDLLIDETNGFGGAIANASKLYFVSNTPIWENNSYHSSFYAYDIISGVLENKISFPISGSYWLNSFILNGYVYFYQSEANKLFKYDHNNNSWIPRSSIAGYNLITRVGVSINNYAYIVNNNVYKYDDQANNWEKKCKSPISNDYGGGGVFYFVLNNKLYLGSLSGKFYEYDPSLEP